jgi:hypothetical protein
MKRQKREKKKQKNKMRIERQERGASFWGREGKNAGTPCLFSDGLYL